MSKLKKYKDLVSGQALENAKMNYEIQSNLFNSLNKEYDNLKGVNEQLFHNDNKYLRSFGKEQLSKNPNTLDAAKKIYQLRLDNVKDAARESNKLKASLDASKSNVNSLMKKQKMARLGTAGALALAGAGAYGLKKIYDKKKQEKTAFDIVNDSFEKIALTKEDIQKPNNVIRGAIENMDTLYKMAYGIDNAIDKDNLTFK